MEIFEVGWRIRRFWDGTSWSFGIRDFFGVGSEEDVVDDRDRRDEDLDFFGGG